ncbi:MAG: hypothetical protein H6837_12345 [Planctomycetes bacterium]|nr:hypothetical protein [Planctomycetota bacterium]
MSSLRALAEKESDKEAKAAILNNIGVCLIRLSRNDEARDAFSKSVALHGGHRSFAFLNMRKFWTSYERERMSGPVDQRVDAREFELLRLQQRLSVAIDEKRPRKHLESLLADLDRLATEAAPNPLREINQWLALSGSAEISLWNESRSGANLNVRVRIIPWLLCEPRKSIVGMRRMLGDIGR